MPDLYDNGNVIDKAYDVFSKVQKTAGQPAVDEVSFVGGFIACFGILTGRVDIGLDQHAPLDQIMDNIHEDIAAFGQRVQDNQEKQDRLDHSMRNAVSAMTKKRKGGT